MHKGLRHVFLDSVKDLERQATAVVEISHFARSVAKPDAVLAQMLEKTMALIGADAGAILLADTENGNFEFGTAKWAGRSEPEAAERQKALKVFQVKLTEGIAGQVFQSQEPVLLPDLSKSAAFRKEIAEAVKYEVTNLLAVPLLSDDGPRGVLELFNKKPKGTFSGADMQLAGLLAGQIALVLDVHRLRAASQGALEAAKKADQSGELQEARRIAREAQTQLNETKRLFETALQVQEQAKVKLTEVAVERDRFRGLAEAATPAEYMARLLKSVEPIAFSLSIDTVTRNFMELALRLVAAQAAQVFLWNEKADRLQLAASTASLGKGIPVSIRKGEGLAGAAAERMDLIAVADVTRDDHFSKSIDEVPGLLTRSVLAAPLISHGRLVGVVETINKKDGGTFSADDAVALGGVAVMGAEALEKVLAHQQELATHRAVISRLADTIERRKPGETGRHERLRQMAAALAESLGMKQEEQEAMEWAALLYNLGDELLAEVEALSTTAEILRHAQERWDGKGSPGGLRQEKIPYGARVLAVADTFDGLFAGIKGARPLPLDVALREVENGSGKMFDPACVETFTRLVRSGRLKAIFTGT